MTIEQIYLDFMHTIADRQEPLVTMIDVDDDCATVIVQYLKKR